MDNTTNNNPPKAAPIPGIPKRILIAEDHRVSRHLLERTLENWGFEIVSVENGVAALKILESDHAPPLAILDRKMPDLDGLEVCKRVRQRTDQPYIYIILLTALTKQHEITDGLDAGADDYVTKPFDFEELRARVKVGERVVLLERALRQQLDALQKALADVKKLKQLLPICMYCKSIRDDGDYWRQLEEYIHTATGADFTHGICPTCMTKVRAQLTRKSHKGEIK